jgi:1-acyl-sn-glycerol-3-phosphate acyltransferase
MDGFPYVLCPMTLFDSSTPATTPASLPMLSGNRSRPKSRTQPPSSKTSLRAQCSPWLTSIVYPLGCDLVMPNYFRRITVIGQDHLPTHGSVLLAPTHRSRWDALLVPYATGRRVTGRDLHFMVTSSEVQGIQGWFIRRLGGFPVNIDRPAIASLRLGVELLQQGKMLVIFPEGGIFRDGQVHDLRPGFARIALQAASSQPEHPIHVVPMTLQYHPRMPRWGCEVTIRIGRSLSVADYYSGSPKADAQQLADAVKHRWLDLEHPVQRRQEILV